MTADRWIALLQLVIVILTALQGVVVDPVLGSWLKVAVAAIAAVLLYVFGVQQPIKAAAAKALAALKK